MPQSQSWVILLLLCLVQTVSGVRCLLRVILLLAWVFPGLATTFWQWLNACSVPSHVLILCPIQVEAQMGLIHARLFSASKIIVILEMFATGKWFAAEFGNLLLKILLTNWRISFGQTHRADLTRNLPGMCSLPVETKTEVLQSWQRVKKV